MLSSSANINDAVPYFLIYTAYLSDRNFNVTTGQPAQNSISPISYQVIGDVGNRIQKIEWKNVGFPNEIAENGSSNDFINFQLWLHESTQIVEFRYGNVQINYPEFDFIDDEPGPLVGIFSELNFNQGPIQNSELLMLSGEAENPIAVTSTVEASFLEGTPPNGTVYRFTPTTASIQDENRKLTLQLFPNPTKEGIHLNNVETVVAGSIFDTTGRKVKACNSTYIDCKDLDAGIYTVKITDHLNRVITGTFIKER